MTEARLFYLASPVLGPLIERRKKGALEKLLAAHRDGKTNCPYVSELAAYCNLEMELRSKESAYKTLEANK